jgi:hypothetical protein
MQCVLAAFEILSGQGTAVYYVAAQFNNQLIDSCRLTTTFNFLLKFLCLLVLLGAALQIDPRQFYTQLYGAITHLDACELVQCHVHVVKTLQ